MAVAIKDINKDSPPLGRAVLTGSKITCTTNDDEVYRGNVSVIDNNLRAVVIESESDGCIHIVNLNNVHNYETIGPTVDQESRYLFRKIDIAKVNRRYEDAVHKRKEEISRVGDGVSKEAQQLFNKLCSVYSETRWDGQVIIVMNDVRISSPYEPENCTGKSSALVETVQKMVKRFHFDNDKSSTNV